jgi:16S rRNA (guanine966-N2)-methyltransferase
MSEKEHCDFFCAECLDWVQNNISKTKYDLIFIDPPFNKNLINNLLSSILKRELLSESGKIYFEFEKKLDLKIPKSLSLKKKKSLGRKSYVLVEAICLSS